jgi:hypothetical protein
MKLHKNRALGWAIPLAVLAILSTQVLAQPGTAANSVIGFPGAGALQAGDYWDSFLPQAFGPYYGEGSTAPTMGNRQFLRFGNFDRAWSTPNGHWPAAFPWTMYWSHYMLAQVFDPDTAFNPTGFGEAAPITKRYAQVTYKATLDGANDPNRMYSIEPYFVDGDRRQHAVYEAAWPTNVGLDVHMRAHAFSGPNWNNFNDFIIVEIEFKNTGKLDIDLDGTPEKLDNVIKALTLNMAGEIYMSISSTDCGGRCVNSIANKFTRMGGWIADPDPDGFPWAFNAYYPGAMDPVPAPGKRNFGFNAPTLKMYTDTWDGWVWLDVKEGGLPTDPRRSTSPQTSKSTIFATHPIGIGPQRGWYVSTGSGVAGLVTVSNPRMMFDISAGAFLKNGGSSRVLSQIDESPNPNFFSSGTQGDVTTFVPKASPGQPNGDQKTLNTFDQQPFEDGTGYPAGWGKWTAGYNFGHDFNGEMYSGVGPFRIEKDASITAVIALVAGYRLEGIQKAVRAARYTYANDFNIPVLPNVPKLRVNTTAKRTILLEWDNGAESDASFAGYKIWKSTQVFRKEWLDEGLRLADRYQEQMIPGESKEALKKPVNPKFDAIAEINSTTTRGVYQPDCWGTWELLKVLSKSDLASATQSQTPGYRYAYEDKDVVLGGNYWYYISAYKEGNFTGPGGESTNRIETHSVNRNGASGLWTKTYPFAPLNANFPKDAAGLAAIGARKTVLSPTAASGDVADVSVRPNPYKRAALVDNFFNVYEHRLLFYNLPPQCKITILDVAGQIIDQIAFTASDPNNGSYFWDMFSKDGTEVASGLYMYVVESPSGGQKVGYFSILR